jgi:hypothetical protein
MSIDDIKGLKYYILYCIVVLGFFVYSGMTGWKWYNSTTVESERTPGAHPRGGSYPYRYHK